MTSKQQKVIRDIAKKVIDDQLVWISEQVGKDIEYLKEIRKAIEEQESSEIEIIVNFDTNYSECSDDSDEPFEYDCHGTRI
tara:strand:+ start:62 stop:304 length:243 start_codon:yes stop_codon:yes gene_type:complete